MVQPNKLVSFWWRSQAIICLFPSAWSDFLLSKAGFCKQQSCAVYRLQLFIWHLTVSVGVLLRRYRRSSAVQSLAPPRLSVLRQDTEPQIVWVYVDGWAQSHSGVLWIDAQVGSLCRQCVNGWMLPCVVFDISKWSTVRNDCFLDTFLVNDSGQC